MSVASSPTFRRPAAALEWWPVLIGLLVLAVPTFYDLSQTLWPKDEHAHGPLILLVVIWLIWQERQALLGVGGKPRPIAGTLLLVTGLLIYIVGRSQAIPLLEVAALMLVMPGILLLTRGSPALRAMWFAVLFMVFLIPLPGIFVETITASLKQVVSRIAENLLYTAGYPIGRTGVALTIGQYQLLVADACSGLNSMFSLSALGLLYLYLIRHRSWLRNGILVASILPIAFCANIVRVMVLVLVTYHFGDEAGQGIAHGAAGIILFIVALVMLMMFDSLLQLVPALRDRRT